jgi:RNA polymerase sigma-70 factor (ECF subfamily)
MSAIPKVSALGLPLLAGVAHTSRGEPGLEAEVVALFDRLRQPLLRYLLSFGADIADAEEIVQEVFLALFQHLRKGKSRANLQAWTFTVAHNLALKSRQRLQRQAGELTDDHADLAEDPEEYVAGLQRQDRLQAVVRALPELDQCCLSLRAEGLRYRDIAAVLKISLGSVASSLEKSLTRLARADATNGRSTNASG